ncbi:MAG: redoxin domain-containing protein [Candidatus Lokiarchaeota archaeon]|nr:redoxin domain-containing protein [Candidatus Lokiarchaeota archaeon]
MNKGDSDHPPPPMEGMIAPDFKLPSSDGEEVHLIELIGTCIVLVFFPQTFEFFSTMEMRAFVTKHIALEALGAKIIGISVEPVQALRTFDIQEEIPFPLLSDFEREVCKKYGVFVENMDGFRHVSLPAVFVINKKQRITYRWVGEKPDEFPDLDVVMGVIKGFKQGEDNC